MINITSWTELAAIRSALNGDYVLTANLSSSDADYASAGGSDWTPIGTTGAEFTGTFDGDGFTISDLVISTSSDYNGLFGRTAGATIENVGLIDVDVTAGSYTGGLVGYNGGSSSIVNSYATGGVSGTSEVGGLVGFNGGSFGGGASIDNSYATGSVSGTSNVGGLIGNYERGTQTNNGWYTGAGGGATHAIGSTSGSVTNETATLSDFYDKTYNVYDANSPVWDFTTPIWYEHASDYPSFIPPPVPVETVSPMMMFFW